MFFFFSFFITVVYTYALKCLIKTMIFLESLKLYVSWRGNSKVWLLLLLFFELQKLA